MPIFSSKGKDIQGYIRPEPEEVKTEEELEEEEELNEIMEAFKREYGTEYEAVPRPEEELKEELREGYEFDPDPHFEHFLLDNRPELNEGEQSVVRV